MASITDANAFKPPPRRKRGALAKAAIWVAAAMVVLAAFWTVMLNFVARPYLIPSESTAPTLYPGDRIIVNEFAYRFASPRPGDVVVFKGPPNWNVGYKSIRSQNTALRWLQNALSVVGLVHPDENDLVKRIVAVGGQTVECRASTGLTVDGQRLTESYLDPTSMGVGRSKHLSVPGAGVRACHGPRRQALGNGRQSHSFCRFTCALHERAVRAPAGSVVHW